MKSRNWNGLDIKCIGRIWKNLQENGTFWTNTCMYIHAYIQACTCISVCLYIYRQASLVAQRLKCLPAMQETWVRSLGWEDPLEKEMATHSSILAWRIPGTEEPGGLQPTGLQRVGHDWVTSLYFTSLHNIERKTHFSYREVVYLVVLTNVITVKRWDLELTSEMFRWVWHNLLQCLQIYFGPFG